MVYTRSSSNVTTVAAAHALLALRSSSTKSNEAQFWTNWTNWYHTFVSEVQDEMRSAKGFNRFAEAETRWATFCANKLRCDVEQVQSWLKHSDVNARMSLAGY